MDCKNRLLCRLTLKNNLKGDVVAANVSILYTIGDVHCVRGGRKKPIKAIPFKKPVKLKDGDRIVTGAQSYVFDLSDEPGPTQTATMLTAYPNSEFVLWIKGLIRRVELVRGLFRVVTEKEVITPTAELRFPQGNGTFWVDVSRDGTVVVAAEAVPMEVLHKKTKQGVAISFKEQVTVTKEEILGPYDVDQRFKKAYETYFALSQSQNKFLFGDMLEKNVPQETAKLAKAIEEATGEKQDYNQEKHEKWLKKERDLGERKLKEVVETELPEFGQVEKEVQPVFETKFETVEINRAVNYTGIEFEVSTLEQHEEFNGRNAPEEKKFLIVNIEAINESGKQIYIFYDEEVRLITKSGDVIPLENYKMETSFDSESKQKGFFLFIIPKEENEFKLQFGKKSLSKVELELNLSKDDKEG